MPIYLFSCRNSVLQTAFIGSPSAITQGAETPYSISARAISWAYVSTHWSINMFLKCRPKTTLRKPDIVKVVFSMFLRCCHFREQQLSGGSQTPCFYGDRGYRARSEVYGVFPVNYWSCRPRSLWCFSAWWAAWCPQEGVEVFGGMERQRCRAAPLSLIVLNDYTFWWEWPLFIYLRACCLDHI